MKLSTKVAILDLYDNFPNEGMRCIKMIVGEFMAKEGIKGNYDIFNVRAENQLPELEDYDIYISTGGPGSPLFTGEKWENNYLRFIDRLFLHNQHNENKKYLFAICHSFQLLVQHFQLGNVCKRKSTSFGVMPVHMINNAKKEPFFQGLEDPFWVVDSRDYQLIEPNQDKFDELGAEILCLEKERPHVPLEQAIMAIRFSNEVFGTQFHPEADAEGMQRYFLKEDKRKAVIDEHGEDKYIEMIDRLDDPDKIILTESIILPTFLNLAGKALAISEPINA